MSKSNKGAKNVQGTSNAKTINVSEIVVELRRGRPTDPHSANQLKKARIAANGTAGKRGRPSDPESANAKKIAGLLVKKQELGVDKLPQGRKVDPTSKRQAKMAAMQSKIDAAKAAKIAELKAAGYEVVGA